MFIHYQILLKFIFGLYWAFFYLFIFFCGVLGRRMQQLHSATSPKGLSVIKLQKRFQDDCGTPEWASGEFSSITVAVNTINSLHTDI